MIWMISSGVLFVLSLVLIGAGLFWDRPGFRGRPERRCRRCSYDLSDAGEVPVKCTECGREHATEKSLRRVRRHKRVVLLGLLLLLSAGVLSQVPRGLRGELFEPLPSWALVELQPLFPEYPWSIKNHPSRELSDRVNDRIDPMPHSEFVNVINAIADGSVFAEAGSKRWGRTSGGWFVWHVFRFGSKEDGWNYPDQTPADAALNDAFNRLMSVLPEWDPGTREKWPAGFRVKIESGAFRPKWPTKGDLNERAILRLNGYETIIKDGFINHFDIDPVGTIGDVIEGQIELSYFRVRASERDGTETPVRTEQFPVRWEVVADVEDAVDIVTDASLFEDFRNDLVLASRDGDFYPAIMQNPAFDLLRFEGLGVGLRITLLDGAEPITEWHLRWHCEGGKLEEMTTGGADYVPFHEVDHRINAAVLAQTLRVRVVGDPRLALENLEADRVWEGGFEMMYHEAAQEEAPPESTGP